MKTFFSWTVGLTIGFVGMPTVVQGQSITPAEDGTGTAVSVTENQYDISAGTQSGANLFHSFEQLGLSEGEIANFLSNPDVEHILGRVTGGDASFINGLLQVSGGDSNLFLMNPAGVIFGENAQLNVPADFSATTANAIGLDEDWFRAIGTNNYEALSGIPDSFAFTTNSLGAIVNSGNLSVDADQRIQLVGGLVVNTGTLSTPGGEITIEAVPEKGLVSITQSGNLLSLGLPVATEVAINGERIPEAPQAFPQLLSGAGGRNATGISVEGDVVRLTRSDTVIPAEDGVAIVSGTLDVANTNAGSGGSIDVLGARVALVDAQIEASGAEGGGIVHVGGSYRGEGNLPNAKQTFVDSSSIVDVSGGQSGNGGRGILWSDESTQFYGTILATGGDIDGDGGLVEVSSQGNLVFLGTVAVESVHGDGGTLLLDPTTIHIIDIADGDGTLDDELTPGSDDEESSQILAEVLDDYDENNQNTISVAQLEAFPSGTQLLIQANDGIKIGSIDDNELNIAGSISFQANANDDDIGDFVVEGEQRAAIIAEGRVEILAASIVTGDIRTNSGINIDSSRRNIESQSIVSGSQESRSLEGIVLRAPQGDVTVETISSFFSYQPEIDTDVQTPAISVEAGGVFQAIGILNNINNVDSGDNPPLVNIDEDRLLIDFLQSVQILDENEKVIPKNERPFPQDDENGDVNMIDVDSESRTVRVIDVFPASVSADLFNAPNDGPYITIQHGGVSISSLDSNIAVTGNGSIPFVIGPTDLSDSFAIVTFQDVGGDRTEVARVLTPLNFPESVSENMFSGSPGAIFVEISSLASGDNNGSSFALRNRPFISDVSSPVSDGELENNLDVFVDFDFSQISNSLCEEQPNNTVSSSDEVASVRTGQQTCLSNSSSGETILEISEDLISN